MTISHFFKNISLFESLSSEQKSTLIKSGETLSIKAEKKLFQAGEEADGFYLILAGEVKVSTTNLEGETHELLLKEGNFFGEHALFEPEKQTATLTTQTLCTFFVLRRAKFVQELAHSTDLALNLFVGLIRKFERQKSRFYQELRKKLEIQFKTELERHQTLSKLVTGVAHQIGPHLGFINLSNNLIAKQLHSEKLESLLKEETKEQQLQELVESTRQIKNRINQMNQLLQTLKKTALTQMKSEKEEVVFVEFVEEAIELFQITTNSKIKISLKNKLSDPASLWFGSAALLSQILLNLLSNVEQHAYSGEETGEVMVVLSQEKNQKEITQNQTGLTQFLNTQLLDSKASEEIWFNIMVRDFGKGISLEALTKVFEPFFTTAHKEKKAGLGLAVVYNLVTSGLKGTIGIQSKVNQGTIVNLTFSKGL